MNLQDVMSVLGTPNSVYFKSEELNKLGNKENFSSGVNVNQQNDYFYNYITLGMVFVNYSSFFYSVR